MQESCQSRENEPQCSQGRWCEPSLVIGVTSSVSCLAQHPFQVLADFLLLQRLEPPKLHFSDTSKLRFWMQLGTYEADTLIQDFVVESCYERREGQ